METEIHNEECDTAEKYVNEDSCGLPNIEIGVENSQIQLQKKSRTSKRPKGPPITCLLCKKIWDKTGKGGRLFMFGGSRPFMAKFEAKMKALVGKRELESMKNISATKFGRSYICRECYTLVRQAYDGIRKIQRSVAKSVQRVALPVIGNENPSVAKGENDECSESDQDLEIDYRDDNTSLSRRTLPPVSERIAQKIASLKFVTINYKTPILQLERIRKDIVSTTSHSVSLLFASFALKKNTFEKDSKPKCFSDSKSSKNKGGSGIAMASSATYLNNSQANEKLGSRASHCSYQSTFATKDPEPRSSEGIKGFKGKNLEGGEILCNNTISNDQFQPDTVNTTQSDPQEYDMERRDDKDLRNVLSNPLLLIKSRQPIQLGEVKNENVYICTQRGCEWIFTSKFFWENHIRHFHCSGKPYQCPFDGCGRSFTGKSKLELHMRSHTDERPFICDKCGHGFRGNQELKAHKLTHTNEKAYQCPKCDKSFKLLSSMKRHLQFHDGNLPYQCDHHGCKKTFKSKYDLKCHYRLHTGEKPYKCKEPGCGMAFRIPCQFTMHKRAHTGERPFACTVDGCNMAYASSNTLQAHMLTHTTDRPFCCEFCGKTLKHKLMYKAHLKKHEGPKNQACPVKGCTDKNLCKKTLNFHLLSAHNIENLQTDKTSLLDIEKNIQYSKEISESEYHERELKADQRNINREQHASRKQGIKHSNKKGLRLLCPFGVCGKDYEHAAALQAHLTEAHIPAPREKMCGLCGLAFPTRLELQEHINLSKEHTGQSENGFVCRSELCGLRFSSQESLTDHLSWHLGNPPFKCETENCSRTFLLERIYNTHRDEHKNLKPFACSFDECFENFKSLLKLLRHSKTHYGSFKCPIDGCNKSMKTLYTARMHLQIHEKPFACFSCDKRFASCAQWLKHKKSHSGEISFFSTEEDCGNTFSDNASLEARQGIHSDLTSLCPECGKVYKVTIKKHQCKEETGNQDSGGKELVRSSSPPPQQHQQQQLQQFQFNQQHSYLSSGHHHETVGPLNIQVHSLPDSAPPHQHEQTHFVLTPMATIQQGLPQTMQKFHPLSSIPSLSESSRSHISSHTMAHLKGPSPIYHSSHIMHSPTLRTALQSEEWQGSFKQSIPQPSPQPFQQHYKMDNGGAIANQTESSQSYIMAQARVEGRESTLRHHHETGTEINLERPSNYSYVIVNDTSAQQ